MQTSCVASSASLSVSSAATALRVLLEEGRGLFLGGMLNSVERNSDEKRLEMIQFSMLQILYTHLKGVRTLFFSSAHFESAWENVENPEVVRERVTFLALTCGFSYWTGKFL